MTVKTLPGEKHELKIMMDTFGAKMRNSDFTK